MVSAIAQSRSLRELSFTGYTAAQVCTDRVWAAFLGFALFRENATHGIHTVHLSFHNANAAEMTRVLTEENPVTFLAALHDGCVETGAYSRKPLTTVRVNAQVKVLHDHKTVAPSVKTLAEGTHDGECFVAGHEYGDYVRVLAPGIGFCCVPRKDVQSETLVIPTGRHHHPVRSLTLRVAGWSNLAAMTSLLALIGEPLTELTLMNIGEPIREAVPLDAMLQSCPHLRRLELSRVTVSLNALIPTGWGHALESLTLRSCEIRRGRWAAGPSRVPLAMFPQLQSLYVDARDLSYVPAVPALLMELAVARDLQRFVMLSDDVTHHRAYQLHVQSHHGNRLCALPLRHTLALLSVVSAGGAGAKYRLNADVVTIILAMVAPAIRTRICTLL